VSSFLFNYRSLFPDPPGQNLLDGGAPFYDTYETKDGKYVAVGALEPQFYAAMLEGLKLNADELPHQHDRDSWPQLRQAIAGAIGSRTQDEIGEMFEGNDSACVTPVLEYERIADHPHNKLNKTFYRDDTDGKIVPNPAPLLSRTPGFAEGRPQPSVGEHTAEILREHGYTNEQINDLSSNGIIYGAEKSKL